ncbi:MAG: hypothetical protein KCHDKBKB_02677 [Elusimicrobia bacterium]|nr:hypothetical protein [Elusimicrobiota bacterium]
MAGAFLFNRVRRKYSLNAKSGLDDPFLLHILSVFWMGDLQCVIFQAQVVFNSSQTQKIGIDTIALGKDERI